MIFYYDFKHQLKFFYFFTFIIKYFIANVFYYTNEKVYFYFFQINLYHCDVGNRFLLFVNESLQLEDYLVEADIPINSPFLIAIHDSLTGYRIQEFYRISRNSSLIQIDHSMNDSVHPVIRSFSSIYKRPLNGLTLRVGIFNVI